MSIRFKFRSAASYDTVEIGENRNSITVKELKAKIIRQKNLNLCQDFDLVFSDATSGKEYDDDQFQISSGSCVIVKRVPAGMKTSPLVPVNKVEKFTVMEPNFLKPAVKVDDFDDFGTDFCPLPDELYHKYDLEFTEKDSITIEKANLRTGSKKKKFEAPKILVKSKEPVKKKTDLPSELKCSICDKFFKNAVMIPCCQHSFCEKCISIYLIENAKCAKCLSSKCKVKDLLPNVSLRQAIHQLTDYTESDLRIYVPDGESGIQGVEFSYGVNTVFQKEPELPNSPTDTGKGSNQLFSSHLNKITQYNLQDEGDSTIQNRRATQAEIGGGDWGVYSTGRQNKGDRTCYTCGSTEHYVKDCPVASTSYPMFQTGCVMPNYPPPYWTQYGPSLGYMYGPGRMGYPVAPFSVPQYVPPMYGGNMAPLMGNEAIQHPEKRRKYSDQYMDRGRSDEYKFNRKWEDSESYSYDKRWRKHSSGSDPSWTHHQNREQEYERDVRGSHYHKRKCYSGSSVEPIHYHISSRDKDTKRGNYNKRKGVY